MAGLTGDREDGGAALVIENQVDPAGGAVLVLSGELDISNGAALEEAVASAAAEHPDLLIFDLAGLRFMDSSGISVLLDAATKVKTVQVRDPSPIVRRIIQVTGLSGVLGI